MRAEEFYERHPDAQRLPGLCPAGYLAADGSLWRIDRYQVRQIFASIEEAREYMHDPPTDVEDSIFQEDFALAQAGLEADEE